MQVVIVNSQSDSFEVKLNKALSEINSYEYVIKDIKVSTVVTPSGSIHCTGTIIYDHKW